MVEFWEPCSRLVQIDLPVTGDRQRPSYLVVDDQLVVDIVDSLFMEVFIQRVLFDCQL
jgi:hypothetical protein